MLSGHCVVLLPCVLLNVLSTHHESAGSLVKWSFMHVDGVCDPVLVFRAGSNYVIVIDFGFEILL